MALILEFPRISGFRITQRMEFCIHQTWRRVVGLFWISLTRSRKRCVVISYEQISIRRTPMLFLEFPLSRRQTSDVIMWLHTKREFIRSNRAIMWQGNFRKWNRGQKHQLVRLVFRCGQNFGSLMCLRKLRCLGGVPVRISCQPVLISGNRRSLMMMHASFVQERPKQGFIHCRIVPLRGMSRRVAWFGCRNEARVNRMSFNYFMSY